MAKDRTATIIFKGEDQISPAIKGATASVGGLSTALTQTATQSGNAIRDNLIKQIEAARQKISEFAKQGLKVEQGQALGELRRLNGELKKLDQPLAIKPKVEFDSLQLNAISQSFGAIAGKLTELRGAAVGAFTEIAQAERKLSTVSGESKQLIANFRDLAAANKFQATTAQLANASYEVLSAGFTKTADVTKILDASTKGAVGGFSDVTTVSKATISALNAYGASADQAGDFVDKFVSVQQSGLITVDQYAQQLPKIASIASNAGLSIDELNGAIATSTSAGVSVESTFSGLRTALGAILKPSSEAVELSKELGVSFDASALKTKGLSGILKELKASGNDSADTLLKLFGSTEALAAIAPSINSIEKLEANIAASANSAGLASTNFEKAIDPIKAFQNETTEALAVLGEDIVKVFNPVIGGAKAVVAAFRALPEPLQEIIAFVVGGGAAIATTGAAISGFLAILTPTLAGLSALGTGAATALSFLTAGNVALGAATATTTTLTAAEAAAFGGVAAASGTATAGVGTLTTATATLGTTAGVTAGTLGLIGLAVASLIPAGAQLAAAFNVSEGSKSLDDLQQKLKEVRAERDKIVAPVEAKKDDGLGQGQGGLIPTRFSGDIFGQQRGRQKEVIALADNQKEYNAILEQSQKILSDYGLTSADAGDKARLGSKGIAEFTKKVDGQKEEIDLVIASLKQQASGAKDNPVLQTQLNNEIAIFARRKKLLDDRVKFLTEVEKKEATIAKRSSEDIEEAAKKRINAEKRSLEESARARAREFDKQAKSESGDFEKQARADQQAFEKSLNAEKKTFDDTQKADREAFEKGLLAEQRTFNDGERSKDATYQKSKQDQERAFNAAQQAQKAAFDKQQQDASRAFDAQQNAEKLAAESQFSQRRLEIERQLQLDQAKTPEDRAKLEADFKAADEKAAREKAAFAQLKKDEEAFALKQQQTKIAFEESQKLAAQTFEANQQAAKLAFDDQLKLKDQEYEKQKEAAKLAFEDTLKARRDELEAGQSATKLAFEEQLALRKQEFEDAERAKKDAFELSQNEKKAAFEESERAKKAAFEDNLKALEAKFKADERAKDLANAQQVAAIKNATPASAIASKIPALAGIGVKPLATGGRFNAGEQLLVGERGAELVKFGNGGFVNNASDTKQILQSNSPASTMSTAKIEGLLLQLVGKLDRPNIAVTTAENPSDTLVKIQREIGRSLAVGM